MKKLTIKTSVLLFPFFIQMAQSQTIPQRKPDMNKIMEKAIKNFNKALLEGRTFKESSLEQLKKNVIDYKSIPADARVPGQFEENQAIAMTWNYNDNSGPSNDKNPYGKLCCDLATQIQKGAKVIIRIKRASDSAIIEKIMKDRGTPLTNYSFYVLPIDDWWDRDSGPISFYYGNDDKIGMIDLDYYTLEAIKDNDGNLLTDFKELNQEGRINDDQIPVELGKKFNYQVYKSPLNDEGGNVISDGVFTFWGSDGTRRENTNASSYNGFTYYYTYPLPTQVQYDKLYKGTYKINNHVEGKVFSCDGGTGHIDIYAKLIDENTLAMVDYSPAINHDDLDEWKANLEKFQNVKDGNGKKMNIRLVPMPRTEAGNVQTDCEGDQRTYLNGLFVNKNYIMPIQSDPAKPSPSDVEAIEAFKKAMPGYNILTVDGKIMFGLGGSVHCITMQIPAENPVFIRHSAIAGSQPLQTNYTINAYIKNKSGLESQFVYYRKSGKTDWIALPMKDLGGNNYTANIPSIGFVNGESVEYFIEATSKNGKKMSKPFVAREGGFNKFTIETSLDSQVFDSTTNFALSIFPNPNDGSFTLPISLDGDRNVSIEVYDALGRSVYTKKMTLGNGLTLNQLDLKSEINASGIYYIRTLANSALLNSQTIVIE